MESPTADRPVLAGKVGYVFTEDDENTLFWVMEGRVEAGDWGSPRSGSC